MADVNGLLEAMKRVALGAQESTKPVRVLLGEVISKSPLKIRVEQKLVLSAEHLILTRNVTDFATTVSVSWETGETGGGSGEEAYEKHRHPVAGRKQITVHNGLNVGERVILISQHGGQEFLVVDRIGGAA